MGALLGAERSRLAALRFVAGIARLPGGSGFVSAVGRTRPPPEARGRVAGTPSPSRVGATVGARVAADAIAALPPLGAGLIEVGPLTPAELASLRPAISKAQVPVSLRDARGKSELAAVVLREATPQAVRQAVRDGRSVLATTSDPSPSAAADLLAAGADAVLATPAALVEAGPGWFSRTTHEHLARSAAVAPARVSRAWMAGLALGFGMVAGGLGAAVESLGPVLLPYESTFLGVDADGLAAINPRLVPFLQHDRITLAGTMVAIGILYGGLSWSGIRRGRVWARDALLASGLVGFPTLFYVFAYRYVEPVHVALAVVLFPLFLIAVWRRPVPAPPEPEPAGAGAEWQRALAGQLLMVTAGAGLVLGGLTISLVGLTTIFVPSDLSYMGTTAQLLDDANRRLLSYIAHDRAGFGGALISAGMAVLLLATWGWRRGQGWVWWSLAGAAAAGFGAALAVHLGVAYTDFPHVAPVYAGILVAAAALALGRSFLLGGGEPSR